MSDYYIKDPIGKRGRFVGRHQYMGRGVFEFQFNVPRYDVIRYILAGTTFLDEYDDDVEAIKLAVIIITCEKQNSDLIGKVKIGE